MDSEFPDRFPVPPLLDPVEVDTNRLIVGELEYAVAFGEQGQLPGGIRCPNAVTIDTFNNDIYVAEGELPNFGRVSLFSEAGEFLKTYSHRFMNSLHGIAIHGDNMYVTDWGLNAVLHIKVRPYLRFVAKKGSKGSGIGYFRHPSQLSISTNGDLYIADSVNNRIQIMDSNLIPIRMIVHHSMHDLCDVKLAKDEIYVLSECDSPCLHVFSYIGEKIRSIITRGVGMQVTEPFCLCFDASNNFLISDFHAHAIKIFSNDGKALATLGERGHDLGMFIWPTALAITSNQSLLVASSNSNYVLQIFSSL